MLGMGFLLLEIYPIGIQEIPIRLGATIFAIACTTAFIYAMKAVKKESEIARDRRFIMRAFDDIGFQLMNDQLFCLSLEEALAYREYLWRFDSGDDNPQSQVSAIHRDIICGRLFICRMKTGNSFIISRFMALIW